MKLEKIIVNTANSLSVKKFASHLMN